MLDFCENMAKLVSFGLTSNNEVFGLKSEGQLVRDIYKNLHIIKNMEMNDHQTIEDEDLAFMKSHNPSLYMKRKRDAYLVLDPIIRP